MTTNQSGSGPLDLLRDLVRLAVCLWVGWFVLVLNVVLWQDQHPVVAFFVTLGEIALVVLFYLSRRRDRNRAFAAYHAAKARQHTRDRVHRAQMHPELVWEDNVDLWDKELKQ